MFSHKIKVLKQHRCFDGLVEYCEHDSRETKTPMRFSVFRPSGEVRGCIIWLSGLTCTEENFMTKAGAQSAFAKHKLMVICPDTSPRGLSLPGIRDHWEFGEGASFYVDATTEGYADNFRMFSYVQDEFYDLIVTTYGFKDRISIMGHSMGGHGALVIGLNAPKNFSSISAFSPIVNPMNCPWGKKAFTGYLGSSQEHLWRQYDTIELLAAGKTHPRTILVDQGDKDIFLTEQLMTKKLDAACKKSGQSLLMRFHEGYDHSYYFISTFIESHIEFHANALK